MTDKSLIALDAMGGDNAPTEIVAGAVRAAKELGVRVALVGRPEEIVACLARQGPKPDTITIVPATEVIEMDEPPAYAARHKKDSSVVVGLRMVKQEAQQRVERDLREKTRQLQDQFSHLVQSMAREHHLLYGLNSEGGTDAALSSLPPELQERLSSVEQFRDALLRILGR